MNIIDIKKDDCTGCMMCLNMCPTNCITISYDMEGFACPTVDSGGCIGCEICIANCPVLHCSVKYEPKEAYAVQAKDWRNLKNSASGGIAYILCENAITNGGTAYGAAYDDNLRVIHIRAENQQQLLSQQGSKYVQSDFSNIYNQVLWDCKSGKQTIVIGTPCQISGLRNFLKKDFDNLLLVDLICHGVPSPRLFVKYLRWKASTLRVPRLLDYRFRDKSRGWGTNYIAVGNNRIKCGAAMEEPYYADFKLGYSFRESCYRCQYACNERMGDITIGDFWGIENYHPEIDCDITKGVSCILLNTSRGLNALDSIKDKLLCSPSTVRKVIACNTSLTRPANRPPIRDNYYAMIDREGFEWSKKRIKKSKYNYLSWVRGIYQDRLKGSLKEYEGKCDKNSNNNAG